MSFCLSLPVLFRNLLLFYYFSYYVQAILAEFHYLIPNFQCEKVPNTNFVAMLNLWRNELGWVRVVAQRVGSDRAEIVGLKTGRAGPKLGGPDRANKFRSVQTSG